MLKCPPIVIGITLRVMKEKVDQLLSLDVVGGFLVRTGVINERVISIV